MNIRPFQAPETASAQVTLYAAKSVKKNSLVLLFKRILVIFVV
jgi:hypothetical protein